MDRVVILALLAACGALAACTEKPQTASTRKVDAPPWAGTASTANTAPGWKVGDEASWEAQIKARSQGQNEYSRATAP